MKTVIDVMARETPTLRVGAKDASWFYKVKLHLFLEWQVKTQSLGRFARVLQKQG